MLKLEKFTISIPRNGHYQEQWQFNVRNVDDTAWEPMDLTDHTLNMDFRYVAGQGSVLASASIAITDAVNGAMTITIDGSDFSDVDGESEIVTLAYDLADTYESITKIYPRGHALLIPGVS